MPPEPHACGWNRAKHCDIWRPVCHGMGGHMRLYGCAVANWKLLVRCCVLAGMAALICAAMGGSAVAQQTKAEKSNMDLVGHDDLQARSAYQPTIEKQGNRWILYVGHHTRAGPD